jgi:hypothetical protein
MKISILIAAAALLTLASCGKKQEEQQKAEQPYIQQEVSSSVAGIRWAVPGRWREQGARPMRVATYTIPAAEADTEAAECAVFYFGSKEGGDVDMNVKRWISQFENAKISDNATKEINDLDVTLVQISGTYLAPGGPMMQSQGKKENYRLLGAIVKAPEGSVFFKLTGPLKTVSAAETEFNSLIQSFAKNKTS